jgi:hypothetical protein
MEDGIVSFNTGMLAKEKGFNIAISNFFTNKKKPRVTTTLAYWGDRDDISNWNNGKGSYPTKAEEVLCSAPTLSLLQKWLREVKDTDIIPPLLFSGKGYACSVLSFKELKFFKTYDEALDAELYKNLKQLPDYIYEQ